MRARTFTWPDNIRSMVMLHVVAYDGYFVEQEDQEDQEEARHHQVDHPVHPTGDGALPQIPPIFRGRSIGELFLL